MSILRPNPENIWKLAIPQTTPGLYVIYDICAAIAGSPPPCGRVVWWAPRQGKREERSPPLWEGGVVGPAPGEERRDKREERVQPSGGPYHPTQGGPGRRPAEHICMKIMNSVTKSWLHLLITSGNHRFYDQIQIYIRNR